MICCRLSAFVLLPVLLLLRLASAETVFERSLPAPSERQQQLARLALEDRFVLQGVESSPLSAAGNGYDWSHSGPRRDKEWAWFLNRHRFFEELYLAYKQTGSRDYANKIYWILEDWLDQYQAPPRGMSFSAAWRPLEAARRILESWDIVYLKLWNEPDFPEHLRSPFRDCLAAHGDYLQAHHALYGNHLITEMIALLKVALLLPEHANSTAWRHYALDTLDAQYQQQFYPSGAHKELSSHYQRVVALSYQQLLDLLRVSQDQDALDQWQPRVTQIWTYFAQIRKPDGFGPLNNDSDQENVLRLLRQNAPELLEQPLASTHFPHAGQVVLRHRPKSPEALWAFFDMGPRGSDHQHEDYLHLGLSFGKFNLLVDNGRYTYTPGPWRNYFQGPRSHNILLVDGHTSAPQPNSATGPLNGNGYQVDKDCEYAWGNARFLDCLGNEICRWRRLVLRIQSDLLVVDHLVTFQSRAIEGFWHGDPDAEWQLEDGTIRVSNKEQSARISWHTSPPTELNLQLNSERQGQKHSGWHSPRFNEKLAIDTASYTTTIKLPTVLAWHFSPNSSNSRITNLTLAGKQLNLTYHCEDQRNQISIDLSNANQSVMRSIAPARATELHTHAQPPHIFKAQE